MSQLNQIISSLKKEIQLLKREVSTEELKKSYFFDKKKLSFKQAINKKIANSEPAVIAEFKRCSPSKGNINVKADIFNITKVSLKL